MTGLVRAPLLTTVMQVASRFLLVWGIVYFFPAVAVLNPTYTTMLVAWSTTEVIRYSYFAVNISFGKVPGWLTWLRYNTFFVLYPMGICSECWLVWSSMSAARAKFGEPAVWGLWGVLGLYVPGKLCFTRLAFVGEDLGAIQCPGGTIHFSKARISDGQHHQQKPSENSSADHGAVSLL